MRHGQGSIRAMAQRPILVLILAAVLFGPAARAEGLESKERTARTSCLSGDYAKGVAILAELFVDTRDPNHIYNQGRCFEQNRKYEDAIGRFQEYLRVARNLSAEEVSEAKKHIADCRQILSEQASAGSRPADAPATESTAPVIAEPPGPETVGVAAVAAQPSGVTEPTVKPPGKPGRGLRTAGIVVGTGGVAAVVAGVLLNLKASSLTSEMEELDGYDPDKESSQKSYRNLGMVGYGVGAACIAAGGVLYLLGHRAAATQAPSMAFAPIIAPGAAGAALTGAF
jgi:hypothetical protein